jgi:hypothetical protein
MPTLLLLLLLLLMLMLLLQWSQQHQCMAHPCHLLLLYPATGQQIKTAAKRKAYFLQVSSLLSLLPVPFTVPATVFLAPFLCC